MPNKKHGPRGAAKMRESGFAGKGKSPQTNSSPAPVTKDKSTADPSQTQNEPPKRPSVREQVAGKSWTGKLPMDHLSELCQKRKWNKPEYTMRGNAEHGFISTVILRKTDPRTQETTQLPPFQLPYAQKDVASHPTAVNARHFAAAYTLFRILNMTNYHASMPPYHRTLWQGIFKDLKKEDEANGRGWMYASDPFAIQEEREKAAAAEAKKTQQLENQRQKEAARATPQPGLPRGIAMSANGPKNTRDPRADHRGWANSVEMRMGKKTRAEIERVVRRHAIWSAHSAPVTENLTDVELYLLRKDVTSLGFRESHVEEAMGICKDRHEIIEWLLVHVPEEDLISWGLPQGYEPGVTLANSDLQKEAVVRRLTVGGYSTDLCEEVLEACGGDEARTASVLQLRLLMSSDDNSEMIDRLTELTITPAPDQTWKDERSALESTYSSTFRSVSADAFEIDFEGEGFGVGPMTIHIRKPFGSYPNVLPVIALTMSYPAYIRLAVTKKALLHAQEQFLGDQMVFNIMDWIAHNALAITESPGRLSDVSLGPVEQFSRMLSKNRDRSNRAPRAINWGSGTATSKRILGEWTSRQQRPAQQQMLAKRQALPAWNMQEAIVHAVNNHQVTIISGETGSGKSTQSVQFILDDLIQRELGEVANIICTQPRRISALGLADRVAEERCSQVGQEVAYIIRGESKVKYGTSKITFVTTGVLLRRLQTSGGKPGDVVAALADVSHVVVDEVHERSLDTDFLLILLRDVLQARRDLKVILMSATLDASAFEAYFCSIGPVARIEIQGRTHPVTDYYLDDVVRFTGFSGINEEEERFDDQADGKSIGKQLRTVGMQINYDLIAATIRYIDGELGEREGGILIFLPGTMEIERTLAALRSMPNIHALPLHASLLPVEQRRVFQPALSGMRKVVAATNVAETSITIEDIVAVIDTGRVKETSFDPQNNMVKLEEVWASKAACKQRRGRAGRVRAGKCYKLFTRNAEEKMLERPDPEIRRVPLEQLCLSVKAMGIPDASGFLASALTPPDSTAVEGAIGLLKRMGALDGDELTALGRHLSMIPADLRCGKLLVYGAIFGCLEACLAISSILSVRSPFFSPRDRRDDARAVRSSFGENHGDLIADLRAYEQWSKQRAKGLTRRDLRMWCEGNFLSLNTLFDISSTRSQFVSSLKDIGFLPFGYHMDGANSSTPLNAHNSNTALVRALIAGAFNPQIARISFPTKRYASTTAGAVELDPEARTIKFFDQETGRVFLHPSSALFGVQTFPSRSSFVSFFEKVATSRVFVRGVTPFNAMALLMFGGKAEVDSIGRGMVVDGWATLRGFSRIGALTSRLRIVLDDLLAKKVDEPELDVGEHEVVVAVRKLIEFDGLDR